MFAGIFAIKCLALVLIRKKVPRGVREIILDKVIIKQCLISKGVVEQYNVSKNVFKKVWLLRQGIGNCYFERSWYPGSDWHPQAIPVLEYELTMWNGMLHDRFRHWWPNGNLHHEFMYKNGRFHGMLREWDLDGNLVGERYSPGEC